MPSLSPRNPCLGATRQSAPIRPLAPGSCQIIMHTGRRVTSRQHHLGPLLHHHPSKLYTSPGDGCKALKAATLSLIGNSTLGIAAAVTLANLCPQSIQSLVEAYFAQTSQLYQLPTSLQAITSVTLREAPLSAPSLISTPTTTSMPASSSLPASTAYLPTNLTVPTSLHDYMSSLAAASAAGKLHATIFVSPKGWQRHSASLLTMLGPQGAGPSGLVGFTFIPLGADYLQRARTAAAAHPDVRRRRAHPYLLGSASAGDVDVMTHGGDVSLSYMAEKYGLDVALAIGLAAAAGGGCSGVMEECPFMLLYDNSSSELYDSAAGDGTGSGRVVPYDSRTGGWSVSPAWRMRQDLDEHVHRRRAAMLTSPSSLSPAWPVPQQLRQQLTCGNNAGDGDGIAAEASSLRVPAFAAAW